MGWNGQLPSDSELKKLIVQWKQTVNKGNFAAALKLEERCRKLFSEQEKILYAKAENVPVIRPGVSFRSAGHFGFVGDWQPLLNFQAKAGTMFRNGKKEYRPYDLFTADWSVVFEPADSLFHDFSVLDGSWCYSHRKTNWRKKRGRISMETWWSTLAPGLLFDLHSPELKITEKTIGTATI